MVEKLRSPYMTPLCDILCLEAGNVLMDMSLTLVILATDPFGNTTESLRYEDL